MNLDVFLETQSRHSSFASWMENMWLNVSQQWNSAQEISHKGENAAVAERRLVKMQSSEQTFLTLFIRAEQTLSDLVAELEVYIKISLVNELN